MATITDELSTDRAVLEKEAYRLEELLAVNPDWRTLRALESGVSAGLYRGSDLAAVSARCHLLTERLSTNRVFAAYRRLREAIELMRDDTGRVLAHRHVGSAQNRGGDSPSPAPVERHEPFRTRLKVKIHDDVPGRTAPMRTGPEAPDDLTRIRGIDRDLAARLRGLGVMTWDEIAGWRREDVRAISAALGLDGRISRENWIEQAAVLAIRRPPAATQAPPPEPAPALPPEPVATASIAAAEETAMVEPDQPPAAPPRPDDLTLISNIDEQLANALNAAGTKRFADISGWTVEDVAQLSVALELGGRICREGWIEQAAMLASGATTAYARRRRLALTLAPRSAYVAALQPDAAFRARLDEIAAAYTVEKLERVEAGPVAHADETASPDPTSEGVEASGITPTTDSDYAPPPSAVETGAARPALLFAVPGISGLVAANDPGAPGAASHDVVADFEDPAAVAPPRDDDVPAAPIAEASEPAETEAEAPVSLEPQTPAEVVAAPHPQPRESSSSGDASNPFDDYDRLATGFERGQRAAPLPAPLEFGGFGVAKPDSSIATRLADHEEPAPAPVDTSLPPVTSESQQRPIFEATDHRLADQTAEPTPELQLPVGTPVMTEPALPVSNALQSAVDDPTELPVFADVEEAEVEIRPASARAVTGAAPPVPGPLQSAAYVPREPPAIADCEEAEVEIRPAAGLRIAPSGKGLDDPAPRIDAPALCFDVEEASVEIVACRPLAPGYDEVRPASEANPTVASDKAVSEPTLRRFLRAFENP